MATNSEIHSFLESFKAKLSVWGVFFLNREKNLQALAKLEIRPIEREQFLRELRVEDYSQGPLVDVIHQGAEMWVFGLLIKEREVYIKISMGRENTGTICISFHLAEHPMSYPLKQQK